MMLKLVYTETADRLNNYFLLLGNERYSLNTVPKLGTFYDKRGAKQCAAEVIKVEVENLTLRAALLLQLYTERFVKEE